ncbi:MAG: heme utilization protein [Alphaproteobacteria bacterium]|nr:heme utilization protein [Alphaproteobacteria bacterium]
MKTGFGVAVLAGLLVVGAAGAARAAACYTPAEARAAQLRQLQTELMVAALQCSSRSDLDLASQYNVFVRRFGGSLSENAKVLRGHFGRQGGGQGRFDSFITSLANQASMKALNTPEFCDGVKPLFDKALAQSPSGLEAFAVATVDSGDYAVCGAGRSQRADAKAN